MSSVNCSVVAPAVAPIAYKQVAPPNVLPFAASVNTFTKGLPLFAAPYAAGVAPVAPAVSVFSAPAPVYPASAPGPVLHAAAPGPFFQAAAPGPFLPPPAAAFPEPTLPGVAPGVAFGRVAPVGPAYPGVVPVHANVAFGARSVHAVAPGLVSSYGPVLPPQILG